MFAAMAVPMIEAQLEAFEATPVGLAKCEDYLAKAREKAVKLHGISERSLWRNLRWAGDAEALKAA